VKIIPEPVLVGIEKTAGILVTLATQGPVAAWEQMKAELSDLKDQMIAQITQMVTTEVVKAAVMKLVSMINPAGAVIQAILAIYNTVTFFISKISQIAATVGAFIDSIAAIAAGQVEPAAQKVEQTMANTLTLIISFLAKLVGLGNVPEKVVGIIRKIRQPIDKGLDKIVAWLGGLLKKVGAAALQAGVSKDPNERFKQGMDLADKAVNRFSGKKVGKAVLTPLLEGIKIRYGFQVLDVSKSGNIWWIEGVLNPSAKRKTNVQVAESDAPPGTKEQKMPLMTVDFTVKKSIHAAVDRSGVSLWSHYVEQLQFQQNKLKSMVIKTWMTNITQFYGNKGQGIAAQGRSKEGDKIAKQIRDRLVANKATEFMTKDIKLTAEAAKIKAREFYSDKAVLHLLDQGAGGAGTEFLGDLLKMAAQEVQAQDEGYLGNARVDYSIGASWPSRAKELKRQIEAKVDPAAISTETMNVKLNPTKK
ncbi:MAG: hypothetical protein HOP19_26465, partial [Acidobacteria bacterium]|nr:hypothetical protein [Acidobacteriota bacterium]